MRFEDMYVMGLGVRLGVQVRASSTVRRGALAATAAREAVAGHEQAAGVSPRAHLHAQNVGKPDFWSSACHVLDQLGVAGCGVTCEIGAMSNGGVLGVEIAASLLGARSDLHTALITVGDRFAGGRFAR